MNIISIKVKFPLETTMERRIYVRLGFLIILGVISGNCNDNFMNEIATAANNDTEERRFLSIITDNSTPITPIVTNVTHKEAMKKLKDLWVTQQAQFEEVKRVTRDLCEKTKQSILPISYVFEEIDPLFVRQVKVLTTLPWENTDEMYEVVDDELIDQQRRSWEALGRCLSDHYVFDAEHQEDEQKLRKLLAKAREDLLRRRKEIVNLEKAAQKKEASANS